MAVRLSTTAVATFTATSDWTDAPTHVRAWIGTNFIGEDDITTPEVLEQNDTYTVPIGTRYDWTVTPDGAAAGTADAGMAALMNLGADEASLRFSLHTAAITGTAVADDELTTTRNAGYARASATFSVATA